MQALSGLGEGDRFRTILPSVDVDIDTLDNFLNGFVNVDRISTSEFNSFSID